MMLLLVLAIAVSGAVAQVDLRPYNLTAAIMFVTNDANNDGILTWDEFKNVFHMYDFNHDGIIERHEYVCYITADNDNMASIAHGLYDEYDANGNHRLEDEDFHIFYNKMDENDDGTVTDLEFVRFWEKLLLKTEHYSLHGHPHHHHEDRYCQKHGHHGHQN